MITASTASKIVAAIVKHQSEIIGPLATQQAGKVSGLIISNDHIEVSGSVSNPTAVLGDLVNRYAQIFGQASVEVCKDAIREANITVSSDDLPAMLK